MGEFKNDDNKSYISIGGLAFGYYSIILSIFDENNNLIVSTNKIFTQLKPYTQDLKEIEENLTKISNHTKPHVICR